MNPDDEKRKRSNSKGKLSTNRSKSNLKKGSNGDKLSEEGEETVRNLKNRSYVGKDRSEMRSPIINSS